MGVLQPRVTVLSVRATAGRGVHTGKQTVRTTGFYFARKTEMKRGFAKEILQVMTPAFF